LLEETLLMLACICWLSVVEHLCFLLLCINSRLDDWCIL